MNPGILDFEHFSTVFFPHKFSSTQILDVLFTYDTECGNDLVVELGDESKLDSVNMLSGASDFCDDQTDEADLIAVCPGRIIDADCQVEHVVFFRLIQIPEITMNWMPPIIAEYYKSVAAYEADESSETDTPHSLLSKKDLTSARRKWKKLEIEEMGDLMEQAEGEFYSDHWFLSFQFWRGQERFRRHFLLRLDGDYEMFDGKKVGREFLEALRKPMDVIDNETLVSLCDIAKSQGCKPEFLKLLGPQFLNKIVLKSNQDPKAG